MTNELGDRVKNVLDKVEKDSKKREDELNKKLEKFKEVWYMELDSYEVLNNPEKYDLVYARYESEVRKGEVKSGLVPRNMVEPLRDLLNDYYKELSKESFGELEEVRYRIMEQVKKGDKSVSGKEENKYTLSYEEVRYIDVKDGRVLINGRDEGNKSSVEVAVNIPTLKPDFPEVYNKFIENIDEVSKGFYFSFLEDGIKRSLYNTAFRNMIMSVKEKGGFL